MAMKTEVIFESHHPKSKKLIRVQMWFSGLPKLAPDPTRDSWTPPTPEEQEAERAHQIAEGKALADAIQLWLDTHPDFEQLRDPEPYPRGGWTVVFENPSTRKHIAKRRRR